MGNESINTLRRRFFLNRLDMVESHLSTDELGKLFYRFKLGVWGNG